MAFRLECVSNLYKNLGRFDAIVEFTELAVVNFIKQAESSGDFSKFIEQQSDSLHIKVNSVDESIYRSRISQSYILSVYQNAELFLHKFKEECNNLKNTDWKLDNSSDNLLVKTIRKIIPINQGKERIGEFRLEIFDYYRVIRNKYSHEIIQDTKVEKAYINIKKYEDEIKENYPKFSAPNEFDNICFDDFLLFSTVLKDIANTLSDIIKPTNEELKNYYLRNDFYKELNQNLERKENALVGHITSKFGIEKEEAKKIISSLRH
ncbi:hypothetical protein EG349_15205 [Chryseobacterium shandongense]|uniref:Uncharacterized protein n=1 Tax=Chryseobacterium shandongense TaxID=1493872 RepID=A0AAD1DMT5_9FLAO|nr:hypothetical protein [Chryseobacterium shandongense]AZA88053.1 hypothetical protein EG349_15205 [Chryseobacterium shandongense]AZA96614.1 hypothetical protein EG353_13990 [Chryseobacterium shandongense]